MGCGGDSLRAATKMEEETRGAPRAAASFSLSSRESTIARMHAGLRSGARDAVLL
jgi:hypothetical protein